MSKIDNSIKNIDDFICRHLDSIEDSTRGVISQNILDQLSKLVILIMVKLYGNGDEIPLNEENKIKALEFAQVNKEFNFLFKFYNFLQTVIVQYTLDENGSERLMLKYYQYLLKAKNLLEKYSNLRILHNLDKFPLHVDNTLQEYYNQIAMKLNAYPINVPVDDKNKYYVQKMKPIVVDGQPYYEVTFTPVDDRVNTFKSNRIIAFTRIDIVESYASKFHITQETIEILGKPMPINIIDGWEVSIRGCEFQNFISVMVGRKRHVTYQEQKMICNFLTKNSTTLTELIDYPDRDYKLITDGWRDSLKELTFLPILDECRNLIKNNRPGQNVLRYLLYTMNNVVIKKQYDYARNEKLSNLYVLYGCIQFDSFPFNRSLVSHNPKQETLFNCMVKTNRKPEMLARYIKTNTECKGKLFTNINDIKGFDDIEKIINSYNNSLWKGHRPRGELVLDDNQIFINEYKMDVCNIIEKLKKLSKIGVPDYEKNIEKWLSTNGSEIDCDEKRSILQRLFTKSKVGVVYGSAGVGKSTLINQISHYLNDERKIYLTQTNPAKENLVRKIDAKNSVFSTIDSFLNQELSNQEYELIVIDECSTVSNKRMIEILDKASFNMLLLVGDTFQIDSIQFGNWFSVLKSFLPDYAIFELTKTHRTKNQNLLELWDKVRNVDETTKEILEREGYSLSVEVSLFSPPKKDEIILCLNYDGLYGINNINRFLQEVNPNPPVLWNVQQYKKDDPILFLETERFYPVIHNNMKGVIKEIEILNKGTKNECIQFDIEVPKKISKEESNYCDFTILSYPDDYRTIIQFSVDKVKSADEDGLDDTSKTFIPFQIAYAMSIHKAQGLEYNSVKIVITDEVGELVTHDIFYTAITRAKEQLNIYWTPEVEENVLRRIKPRDVTKDIEILKKYID